MKISLTLAFALAISLQSIAQITVTGQVVGGDDQAALVGAQIMVSEKRQVITQVVTDAKGQFSIKLPSGNYGLGIQMMGYTATRQRLTVGSDKLDLGAITLSIEDTELAEAEVTASGPRALNGLDRKIYQVGDDLIAQGGTGMDILRQVPSLTVDIDGTIALRGDENVTILVDGRPAALLGLTGDNAFERIPANSIASVEVVTNPGAKYDASGTGGIINIVTKKGRKLPFNGSFNAGIGTGNKQNAGFTISAPAKNFRLTTSLNWDDRQRRNESHVFRRYDFPDTTYTLNYDGAGISGHDNLNFLIGLDWTLAKVHEFNLSVNLGQGNGTGDETTEYVNQTLDQSFITRATQNSGNSFGYGNDNISLMYKKVFDDDIKAFSMDATYATGSSQSGSSTSFVKDNLYPDDLTYGDVAAQLFNNMGDNHNFNFQSDFSWPVGDEGRLDMGGRYSIKASTEDRIASQLPYQWSSSYVPDSLRSLNVDQDNAIAALYTTYGHVFSEQWKGQLGLRYESASLSFNLSDGSTLSRVYPGLFPSAYLTYTPKKGLEFQGSYSMRVNRPRERALNPVIDYSNPQSLRKGNPELKPETTHSVELSAVQYSRKGSISAAIYAKRTDGMFSRYLTVQPNGILMMTWENFDLRQRIGASGNAMLRFSKTLSIQASADAFYSEISGENLQVGLSQSGFGWQGRGNVMWQFQPKHQLQVTFNHWGAGPTGQGYRKGISYLDMAYKYDIIPKKLFVSMRLSDVFNTRQFSYIQDSRNLYVTYDRARESQILYLSLQYDFGAKESTGRGGSKGSRGGSGGGSQGVGMEL